MRKLVMVHGRSQQNKKAKALKQEWIDCLNSGFHAAGIKAVLTDTDVAFPYYGDTLAQLAKNPKDSANEVIMAGTAVDEAEKEFVGDFVAEVVDKTGITEEQIRAEAESTLIEMGPLNWPWVLAALRVLDGIPGVSGQIIALVTHDVFMYLRNIGIQRIIDEGLQRAVTPDEETVIIGHSLGTVVAYNVLTHKAPANWLVTSLITLGSPLGVSAIVDRLAPISFPGDIESWFNAFDPADTVALHPLDSRHFPVTPAVENYPSVHNRTRNRHGVSGYLRDPGVAARIHSALTA